MGEEINILKFVRPQTSKKFNAKEAKAAIKDIIQENLEGKTYDHMYAPDWTISLTRQVHDKIKEMAFERYKFAVQVIIGEDRGQGEMCVSGSLWDVETDGDASVTFLGDALYCVVAVFAVHCYRFE